MFTEGDDCKQSNENACGFFENVCIFNDRCEIPFRHLIYFWSGAGDSGFGSMSLWSLVL